jgi:hypothetical protein
VLDFTKAYGLSWGDLESTALNQQCWSRGEVTADFLLCGLCAQPRYAQSSDAPIPALELSVVRVSYSLRADSLQLLCCVSYVCGLRHAQSPYALTHVVEL